jgi:hypothetical protein
MNDNRLKILFLLFGISTILTIGMIRFYQIHENHQANLLKAEACIVDGGTVVMDEKYFWSLTSVTCEGNDDI